MDEKLKQLMLSADVIKYVVKVIGYFAEHSLESYPVVTKRSFIFTS